MGWHRWEVCSWIDLTETYGNHLWPMESQWITRCSVEPPVKCSLISKHLEYPGHIYHRPNFSGIVNQLSYLGPPAWYNAFVLYTIFDIMYIRCFCRTQLCTAHVTLRSQLFPTHVIAIWHMKSKASSEGICSVSWVNAMSSVSVGYMDSSQRSVLHFFLVPTLSAADCFWMANDPTRKI